MPCCCSRHVVTYLRPHPCHSPPLPRPCNCCSLLLWIHASFQLFASLFSLQQFFEVDAREVVRRKKQALDALLPGWRSAACRPRFVEGALGPHLPRGLPTPLCASCCHTLRSL